MNTKKSTDELHFGAFSDHDAQVDVNKRKKNSSVSYFLLDNKSAKRVQLPSMAPKPKKIPTRIAFIPDSSERALIQRILEKYGLKKSQDAIRMSLKAMAENGTGAA